MSSSHLGEGRIAYDVEGDGPLVILLLGMGDLRSIYRFTTPALAEAGCSLYPTQPAADLAEHQARRSAALLRNWHACTVTTHTSYARAQERLAAIPAPTLVVMGTRDRDWPDSAAEGRWAADALHGELLLVDGAGHYPQAEFPEVVNPALVTFARRVFGRG